MGKGALWLLGSLGLVVAGHAWGRVRGRASRPSGERGRPWPLWLLYVLIGFPVVVILLAKMFDSAVLGWMFGLSLLFDMLLVPCALLFAVGYGTGLWSSRRARPALDDGEPTLAIRLDRDCVHASDDGDARTIAVDPRSTLATLLSQLRESAYLPEIQGGEATWVVTTSVHGAQPVAVAAQQWPAARLAVADAPLGAYFRGVEPVVRFDYLGRCPPEEALARPGRSPSIGSGLVTAPTR